MEEVDICGFPTFLFSPSCSDLTFTIGSSQKTYFAHKIILAARSPYFQTIFQNPLSNITLPSFSPTVFEFFLIYLYTNRFTFQNDMTTGELEELNDLAKKFEISDLELQISKRYNKTDSNSEQEEFRIQMEKQFWEEFEKFQGNPFLSDHSLQVEDKEFRVHKMILASRSGYFNTLFRWNSQDSQTQLHEIPAETLAIILKFIYNNKLEIVLSLDETLELLKMAQFFQISSLIYQCEQLIIHSDISVSNVCFIWNLAKEHQANYVCETCQTFFIDNFSECWVYPGFLQLHKEALKLALNAGQIATHESLIFQALKKWSQSNSTSINDLLPPQTLFNKKIRASLLNDRRSLIEILTS